jgi:antitoxin YefM
MHVLNFSQARADLKQTMDDVCRDHEPAVITRQRGEPVVLLSLQDYNGVMETLFLTKSATNAKRLRESIDQLQGGQTVIQGYPINEQQAETEE